MIKSKTEGVFLVSHEDGILTITFNQPEARNAIPTEAIQPLADLFEDIAADRDVRVVLVKAEGPNFGGGGDVAGMKASLDMSPRAREKSYFQRLDAAKRMVVNWCSIPQPVVVACQGSVAGASMMYPLAADVVIGEPSTFFLCAHALIGLSPDSGLSYLLPRVIGARRATELFLTGRRVGADEGRQIGLLTDIAPEGESAELAAKRAAALARGPQSVFRDIKKMMAEAGQNSLDRQLDLERGGVSRAAGHPDFEEGVRAFMEKRRAIFPSAN